LIGRTRDDAAGEAYDKVAKLLGLGYPGGPAIDRVARAGNDRAFDFPATRLTHADRNRPASTADGILPADIARRIDFSFSGLKTAVLRLVRERTGGQADARAIKAAASDDAGSRLPASEVADIAASFQQAVTDCLVDRTRLALQSSDAPALVVAGGVAANGHIRSALADLAKAEGRAFAVPPAWLCTDNAAMIAWAGAERLAAGFSDGLDAPARARWPLDEQAEKVRGAGVKA